MLERFAGRRLVMTTAFGMEGCALIDMIARHGVAMPVLYLDTGFLFPETLQLRDRLAQRYPQLSFENQGTSLTPEAQEALYGPELWARDPDTCCSLRKVEPMRQALGDADVWVTGLTRSQSSSRSELRVVEWDWKYQLLKVNPARRLGPGEGVGVRPRAPGALQRAARPGLSHARLHPLHPAVAGNVTGEYTREGRWSGRDKNECGLHQIVGRAS